MYNSAVSRAFRDTNYMPELLVSYKPALDLGGGFNWNLLSAGFNHQSNGRSDVLSRSWNRLFAEFGVERDSLALSARVWYRLPEDAGTDDNPDITDYSMATARSTPFTAGAATALRQWPAAT